MPIRTLGQQSLTSIGSHGNQQLFLVFLGWFDFSLFVEFFGAFAVRTCLFQITFSASISKCEKKNRKLILEMGSHVCGELVLSGWHHFHRLSDLLDVFDWLQAHRDCFECRHSSAWLDEHSIGDQTIEHWAGICYALHHLDCGWLFGRDRKKNRKSKSIVKIIELCINADVFYIRFLALF